MSDRSSGASKIVSVDEAIRAATATLKGVNIADASARMDTEDAALRVMTALGYLEIAAELLEADHA